MATWRYRLDEDFYHYSPMLNGVIFKNDWLEIDNGSIIIRTGYAWDGCTPAYCLLEFTPPNGIWIGIWDGPKGKDCRPVTWKATLLHDVLCQFRTELKGISKQVTVSLFKELLKRNKAPDWMCELYPFAVDLWGPQEWQ